MSDDDINELKRQRDELLAELQDLQCNIAGALGWDMKGETFANAVHKLAAENKRLRKIVDKPGKQR